MRILREIHSFSVDYDSGKVNINGEETTQECIISIANESTGSWKKSKAINLSQEGNKVLRITVDFRLKGQPDLSKEVRKVFSNRLHGYAAPEKDVQAIIDVIDILTNRGISIKRAQAILSDAAHIITLITNV